MYKKTIFWLIWGISVVLFLSPLTVEQGEGIGLDKLYHLLVFAFLTYFARQTFALRQVVAASLLVIYALTVELVQGYLLPWRTLDWYDFLAGVVGVMLIFFMKR